MTATAPQAHEMPAPARGLIRAITPFRLRSIEHTADALGGFGDLAVVFRGTDGREHSAVWAFAHDGYGGGRWEYSGAESLRSARAATR